MKTRWGPTQRAGAGASHVQLGCWLGQGPAQCDFAQKKKTKLYL